MKVPFPVTIEYVEMKPMEKDEMLRNAGTRSGGYSTCVQKCLLSGANIMFSYDFSFNVWLALIMSLDAPCETFDSPSSNHEPDASIGPGWANIAPRWAHIAPQGSPRVTKGRIGRIGPEHAKKPTIFPPRSTIITIPKYPQVIFTSFSAPVRSSSSCPSRCLDATFERLVRWGAYESWMFWWFLMCFPPKKCGCSDDFSRVSQKKWMLDDVGWVDTFGFSYVEMFGLSSLHPAGPDEGASASHGHARACSSHRNLDDRRCKCQILLVVDVIYIYLWVYTIVCEFVLLYLMLLLVFVHGSVFSADFISFVW